ncbi:MAG: hypothetical protein V4613_14325 [Bacteroidota bacterium]
MAKITEIKNEVTNKWVWINPWFVEVLCYYIFETMEANGIENYNSILQKFYNNLDYNAHGKIGLGIDGVGIYFEETLLANETDKNTLIEILHQTKTNIAAIGDEISVAQLEQHELEKFHDWQINTWPLPIKTSSLINLLDIMILILDDDKEFHLQGSAISFVGWERVDGTGSTFV